MTTLSLKNQCDSLIGPLKTTDAARYAEDSLGEALANLETSIGLLEPGDLSRIKAILQKYVGGPSARVNQVGIIRGRRCGAASGGGGARDCRAQPSRGHWLSRLLGSEKRRVARLDPALEDHPNRYLRGDSGAGAAVAVFHVWINWLHCRQDN